MPYVLVKKMFDGTQTEEYLRCSYQQADNRFYNQLFETMPERIELWRVNRKGERCKLLNVDDERDYDPEMQRLFEQAILGTAISLLGGVEFCSGDELES